MYLPSGMKGCAASCRASEITESLTVWTVDDAITCSSSSSWLPTSSIIFNHTKISQFNVKYRDIILYIIIRVVFVEAADVGDFPHNWFRSDWSDKTLPSRMVFEAQTRDGESPGKSLTGICFCQIRRGMTKTSDWEYPRHPPLQIPPCSHQFRQMFHGSRGLTIPCITVGIFE